MNATTDTNRLEHVVGLIAERAEIERRLLAAIVELFYPSPTSQLSIGFRPSPSERESSLLTVNEFCDRARVSRATLYRMIRNGEVSHYKLGGRTLFDERHLKDFLERHQLQANRDRTEKAQSRKR
jgi:excisionase family DNA binding protein